MITVVGVAGITGRMGQLVADIVKSHPQACLGGGFTRSHITHHESDTDNPIIISNNPDELFRASDVVIDFTHSSTTPSLIMAALSAGKPFLSGTTGLSAETRKALHDASRTIPILYASNTSLSLAITKQLVRKAAKLLKNEDYDISILDHHHKWKKDAPSGTALTLGEAVEAGNNGSHPITYASIRSGSVVGQHEVLFGGNGEYITIKHEVTDRRVFARGAVDAALWLARHPPGFYTMDDVLTG